MKRNLVSMILLFNAFLSLNAHAQILAEQDLIIAKTAEGLRDKLVSTRRHLHMHPELSNREEQTARLVAERLRRLGLEEVKTGVGRHGVTALLRGTQPGPIVAVRADMDALPIQEKRSFRLSGS